MLLEYLSNSHVFSFWRPIIPQLPHSDNDSN